MGGGGVEVEGKSASIKSISDSIQSSMACCLSSRSSCLSSSIFLIASSFIRLSLSGSRRQLSIDKNERKRENDEPDAPLFLEGEDVAGEVDVVIRGKQGHQADHDACEGLDGRRSVERQSGYHPRGLAPQRSSLVRQYLIRQPPCPVGLDPVAFGFDPIEQGGKWVSVVLSAEDYQRLQMPQDDEGFERMPLTPREFPCS